VASSVVVSTESRTELCAACVASGGACTGLDFGMLSGVESATGVSSALLAFLTSPEPETSKSVAVSPFFGLTSGSAVALVLTAPVAADVDPVPSLEPLDDGTAPDVDGSAEATPCPVRTAAPIPRATASPPTRPT
jgi:hypothetical protein